MGACLISHQLTIMKTLYIETDSLELANSTETGWLRVIIGDAFDADVRAKQYKGKREQDFFATFSIPNRDHEIHEQLKRSVYRKQVRWVRPDEDVQSVEAFDFAVNKKWSDQRKKLHVQKFVGEVVKSVGGSIQTKKFIPTSWQRRAINFVAQSLSEGKQTLLLELAARFGKTGTLLQLFDYSDAQLMVVANYVKTVNTSFSDTVRAHFADRLTYIDAGDADFEERLAEAVADGSKVVVACSLFNSSKLERRLELLSAVPNRFVVVDEADFGAHQSAQMEKLQKLRDGVPLVLITGTEADTARGSHEVDAHLAVTYFDMLMEAS